MTQAEQGQIPEERKEEKQGVTGQSSETNTHIGSSSGENAEKAGQKAGSEKTIENRQFYETKEEKRQFIHESFQLDMNSILNMDANLKDAEIKLFLDNFMVLAKHPSPYCETEVFEMKIVLVPGAIHYKACMRLLNPD